MVGDGAAVDDGAVDIGVRHVVDPQLDETVVDQDAAAGLDILDQVLIGDGGALRGAHDVLCREREALALLEHDLAALEILETDLRPLGIHQGRDRFAHLLADADQALEFLPVLLVGPVGKIESGDIHAGVDQSAEHLLALTGGPDRADDFRFAHVSSFFEEIVTFQTASEPGSFKAGLPAGKSGHSNPKAFPFSCLTQFSFFSNSLHLLTSLSFYYMRIP